MKIIMLFALSTFYLCPERQEKHVYFRFDNNSEKIFIKEDGSGNQVEELLYRKVKKTDDITYFYIKDLLFKHNKSEMSMTVISKNNIKNLKLLNCNEVVSYVKNVQEEYPIWSSPPKGFSKMYVVVIDDNDENKYYAYEVHWQYYTE